jgi:hypothetical protein
VYSNKWPGLFQRGDNYKKRMVSFKNLLKNHWARRAQIYMFPIWNIFGIGKFGRIRTYKGYV